MKTLDNLVQQATTFQAIYSSKLPDSQKEVLLYGENNINNFDILYDTLCMDEWALDEDILSDILDEVFSLVKVHFQEWVELAEQCNPPSPSTTEDAYT